jgi:two-component system, LytTR family, response regulator
MKEVEELFSEGLFLRVHQSHLINTLYIKNYIKGEGGYVIMQDNSSVPVSRRKKELLLKYFNI